MTTRFAEGTSVSPEKSQAEIAATLRKYGATAFMHGWEGNTAVIAFRRNDLNIRFLLELPGIDDDEFGYTPSGRARNAASTASAYEGEVRRRWRALALAIKAKLEAVETGITTFEDEFLAHIVLPDDSLVGDRVKRQLEEAWRTGIAPARLLALPAGGRT
jgi:hypothetical protein